MCRHWFPPKPPPPSFEVQTQQNPPSMSTKPTVSTAPHARPPRSDACPASPRPCRQHGPLHCGEQISPGSIGRRKVLARGLGPVTPQGHPFVGQAKATGGMGRSKKATDSSPDIPSNRALSKETVQLFGAWRPQMSGHIRDESAGFSEDQFSRFTIS
jgi:hypothetical protein